jgi:hypothetical protein
VTPIVGKPIPIVALSVFLDHTWNEKFSSAVGYSWQDNDNTDAQAPDAFRPGITRSATSSTPRCRT